MVRSTVPNRDIPMKDFIQTMDSLLNSIDRFERCPTNETSINTLTDNPSQNVFSRSRGPTSDMHSLASNRQQKISAIRHQFHLGQYEVEDRLTEIFDKLLEDLVT